MFQHHLLLIFRNLKKYKSSFFINLIGLSAGLTCALLIYLWVNDELQIDKFHQHNGQLFQVMENQTTADAIITGDATAALLAKTFMAEMPEVETALAASPSYWLESSKVGMVESKTMIKAGGKFADQNFFKVFSYPLLAGNAATVLNAKNSLVISENLAQKIFQRTDVVGRELRWSNSDLGQSLQGVITGVFKNIPSNSSEHFDFLVSLDVLFNLSSNFEQWGNTGVNTFVVLKKGADPEQFAAKIKDFMKTKGQKNRSIFIRPYADGYLYGRYENGQQTGGRIEYVKLFAIVAVFILFIACINFMNLSTARASRRMKEVGIKKVLGAQRSALIVQYMGEAMLLTFLSLFVALLVTELLLPQFNLITDKSLGLHFDASLIARLLGITILTGLMAGSYPAFYLSGFHPALALKGKLTNTAGEFFTRRGLVVFQFTLSIVLIVGVLVVYKQIEFVQLKNPGFQRQNVVYFENDGSLTGRADLFMEEAKKISGVNNVSGMNKRFFGDLHATMGDFSWEGREVTEVIKFQHCGFNNGMIETLGMEMAEGRSFSPKFGADSNKIIINETGIRAMRLKDPVGKIFNLWGKDYEIIGIVKDFHVESLHETVKPMFIRFDNIKTSRVMIRMEGGQSSAVLSELKKLYDQYNPGQPFDYQFLDQDFQEQYLAEQRVAVLSRYFAALAVIISCLGLFGLAAFTAERRMKEIGIRKVLGASEWSIIYILSKDFTKPVIISIVAALPLSYLMSRYWLDTFAYRIELQTWYFITAGLLALLISWMTVGMQALKVATVNPIQCLREE